MRTCEYQAMKNGEETIYYLLSLYRILKNSINCHIAKIIGSLLHLTGHSRPEVHQYASYTLKSITEHGNVLKCIGYYLKNTQHKQIKMFVLANNKVDGDVKDDNKAVDLQYQ